MVTREREKSNPRVALTASDERTAREVEALALARGFEVTVTSLEEAVASHVGAVAYAPAEPITAKEAEALAELCRHAAEERRPVVILTAFDRARPKALREQIAVLALLQAHGALLAPSPDVWFETAALLACFGAPAGPRTAVIAPPGGLLRLEAQALAIEEELRGGPRTPLADASDDAPPTDVVLVDPAALPHPPPRQVGAALVIPVRARAECPSPPGPRCLVGLRAALHACALVGAHAERIEEGLGPAPASAMDGLDVKRERVDRSLSRAGPVLGDHECKLLLTAYGVPVTRQGVAATPSAAVRIAQTCGFPVEMKAWEPSAPMEHAADQGGPVVTGIMNPPEVRRAFAQAASEADLPVGVNVIVRVTPPPGRDVEVTVDRIGGLGRMLVVDVPGLPRPLAAPAPLRRVDALGIAAALESSRAGDDVPDRAALADLLVRVSFAAHDLGDRLQSLELGRVVVARKGQGAMVVDCRARLARG